MEQSEPSSKRQKTQHSQEIQERSVQPARLPSLSLNGNVKLSPLSPSIYDTAWLAMVCKDVDSEKRLVFPECFAFILKRQQEDGSWSTHAASVDRILDTLTSLLAMVGCPSEALPPETRTVDMQRRITQGSKALDRMLQDWDVQSTAGDGSEVLISHMLSSLEAFDIRFDFPGRDLLYCLRKERISAMEPEMLYAGRQSAILRLLGGLAGHVDFDRLICHLSPVTGVMRSPASTAALLLNGSIYRHDAEAYLRSAVSLYKTGGVPSVYPLLVSDISWSLKAFFNNRLNEQSSTSSDIDKMKECLLAALGGEENVGNLNTGSLSEASDTAITTVSFRGGATLVKVDPSSTASEDGIDLRTDELEGDPALSVNCSILMGLLRSSRVTEAKAGVQKALTSVISTWSDRKMEGKPNPAPERSFRDLADVLIICLNEWQGGHLSFLEDDMITFEVPVTLCQLASRLLVSQSEDGSWRDSVEATAYALISMSKVLSLPFPDEVSQVIEAAILRGKAFIDSHCEQWEKPDYLWITKATYKSTLLSQLYRIALSRVEATIYNWQDVVRNMFGPSDVGLKARGKLLGSLPLFRGVSKAQIHLAAVESSLFAKKLRASRLEVFAGRDTLMTEDKYLDMIPLTWTACNLLTKSPLPGRIMWEMMLLSMLNYQADEFIESAVSPLPLDKLQALDLMLSSKCRTTTSRPNLRYTMVEKKDAGAASAKEKQNLKTGVILAAEVQEAMERFVGHVLSHPDVLKSPEAVRNRVAKELYTYITAQMTHNDQSAGLMSFLNGERSTNTPSEQKSSAKAEFFSDLGLSYSEWVRSTGADDTSCPYSFQFFCCLISEPGQHCIVDARQQYISESFCRSLSIMCRQYNDYGSCSRDRDEGTLNSLDFPDFCRVTALQQSEGAINGTELQDSKDALMSIAEFERQRMSDALKGLSGLLDPGITSAIQTFVNVTDLFGQIYVARDIASRQRKSSETSNREG